MSNEQSPTPDEPSKQSEANEEVKPAEAVSQEELLARYYEQQRRMSCPGCGEDDGLR